MPKLIGRPGSGVPGWPRRPGAVGLLLQNGRRVFPSPLCCLRTKGRVRVRAGLCSAAWRPRRSQCQTGWADSRGAPGRRPPTDSWVPHLVLALPLPFPSFLPTSIQAAILPAAKESGVLAQNPPGVAVADKAPGTGERERMRVGGPEARRTVEWQLWGSNVCGKTLQESKLGRAWQNSAWGPSRASPGFCTVSLPAWQVTCVRVVNISKGSPTQLCKD